MNLKEIAFLDLERELTVTRRILAALPEEHFTWKPHPKSMALGQLALHVAELPNWMNAALIADELDAAAAPRPPATTTSAELLARFDQNTSTLHETVANFDMATWTNPWTMRRGTQIIITHPRDRVFRIWSVNHMIHHRAQLALYLRLLNTPVPTVYFNTADDPTWLFE